MTLVELVDRWRATRDPRLAALVVEHGARLAVDVTGPLARLKPTAKAAALAEAIAAMKVDTLTPVVGAVEAFVRASRMSWPLVELLAEREPDPRIAVMALALLGDWPALPHRSHKLRRRLIGAVERHGDAGAAIGLAAVADSERVNNLVRRLQRLGAPVDDVELGRTVVAMAGAQAATRAPAVASTADELLAAVRADPGDRGVREVYADVLSAAGDPRGELITLQLLRTAPEREAALLKKHARAWIGPIAAFAESLDGFVFEDGFLAQVPPLKVDKHRVAAVYGDPVWATVHAAWYVGAFTPAMRALRTTSTSVEALATLPRLDHVLERLTVIGVPRHKPMSFARRVRHLTCSGGYDTGWQALLAVGAGNDVIESFELRGMGSAKWVPEGELARGLAVLGENLRTLRFVWALGEVQLERGPSGAWDRAIVEETNPKSDLYDLKVAVTPFVDMRLESLRVVMRDGAKAELGWPKIEQLLRTCARTVTTS